MRGISIHIYIYIYMYTDPLTRCRCIKCKTVTRCSCRVLENRRDGVVHLSKSCWLNCRCEENGNPAYGQIPCLQYNVLGGGGGVGVGVREFVMTFIRWRIRVFFFRQAKIYSMNLKFRNYSVMQLWSKNNKQQNTEVNKWIWIIFLLYWKHWL